MTSQRHENSRNFTVSTANGCNSEIPESETEDSPEQRQATIDADIAAFLARGGEIEQVGTSKAEDKKCRITHSAIAKEPGLFGDTKTHDDDEPGYVTRSYNPVSPCIKKESKEL